MASWDAVDSPSPSAKYSLGLVLRSLIQLITRQQHSSHGCCLEEKMDEEIRPWRLGRNNKWFIHLLFRW